MKTAVEWLVEQIMKHDKSFLHFYGAEIEQAKEMEKEQIIDAYETSHISMMTAEQYYRETYESNTRI